MRPMTTNDIGRMVKRRIKAAGLPERLSPCSFRVATIADLLGQEVPLEDVLHLTGHADPRTTRLYDRRQKKVTRNHSGADFDLVGLFKTQRFCPPPQLTNCAYLQIPVSQVLALLD